MYMQIKNLNNTTFEDIVDCFLEAFENYFVEFPKDPSYFKQRWEMSKINYTLSYGMFDGIKLVGFILHGIENRNSHLTAFNLATGVVPDYRGKKITKTIYEFAISDLITNGISKCQLEVIKQNTYAVKAYQNIGFSITKNYKCFSGNIILDKDFSYELTEINIQDFNFNLMPNQSLYSWENQSQSIKRGNFKCFEILNNNQTESFFIINNQSGYIAQLDVLVDYEIAWQHLFHAIYKICETVKINNVDERLISKIMHLEKVGLKNTINQYQMELVLTSS